ncbi:MAG: CBS domain-containing protein [Betaproteobacteria bacterium]|nr:CBS domain-containing protein [Betaproteobacteria bacterium]
MDERYGFLERRLAGEQQTLARPLRALIRNQPVVCREHVSVREAVGIMHAHGVGSVIVVDDRSRPTGIFTTTDLVAVAARGLDELGIAEVMTRSPFSLPAHALAYEAALAMIGTNIRHVLVMDEDRIIGVVSERDLFSLQRLGLGEITTEIRLAGTVKLLVDLAAEIRKLARLLVEEGVAAEQLTLFVSVLNDRLCQRIIEIERKNHQWESISWCWLAFGSEGRFEQTFSTDQDNGILFSAHEQATPDAVRARLLPFATSVNQALDACGFPLCKGQIMASNPKLCLSLAEWQLKIGGWLESPEPKALLDAAICFDFRPLYGDATLALALREWVLARTRANPRFLRLMAENALQSRPPLGRLRDFKTEDAPNAPHSINLKLYGVRPFVDTARIYALAHAVPQTNTGERLRAARAGTGMGVAETEAMVEAFFVIQRLRLRNQASQQSLADNVANRVDPDKLNGLERHILKGAFRQARMLQRRLALDYQI